jgi:hypothetical protein
VTFFFHGEQTQSSYQCNQKRLEADHHGSDVLTSAPGLPRCLGQRNPMIGQLCTCGSLYSMIQRGDSINFLRKCPAAHNAVILRTAPETDYHPADSRPKLRMPGSCITHPLLTPSIQHTHSSQRSTNCALTSLTKAVHPLSRRRSINAEHNNPPSSRPVAGWVPKEWRRLVRAKRPKSHNQIQGHQALSPSQPPNPVLLNVREGRSTPLWKMQ